MSLIPITSTVEGIETILKVANPVAVSIHVHAVVEVRS